MSVIGSVIKNVIGDVIGGVFGVPFDAVRYQSDYVMYGGQYVVYSAPIAQLVVQPTFQAFPVIEAVASAFESDRFSATVRQAGTSSVDSFVYQSDNDNTPGWSGLVDYQQTANHFTKIRSDDPVIVTINRLDAENITNVVVRPLERSITPVISGDSVTFTLTEPDAYTVEIDEIAEITATITGIGEVTKQIVKHPLFVFFAPLEDDVPADFGAPGLTYYGPGIHEVGLDQALANGSHIYLDWGAVVKVGYVASQSDPSNIHVHGNGVITTLGLDDPDPGWYGHAFDFTVNSVGSGSANGVNNRISGITITDPKKACIVSYNQVHLEYVSMMSWNPTQDGMTPGPGSTSTGWVFVKTHDDQCKWYYGDQTHERIIVWQMTAGSPGKLGWNLSNAPTGNVIEKMIVVRSDVITDYQATEVDRPEWRSTSAIISCMAVNSGGKAGGIIFNNLIIEEEHLLRIMGMRLQAYHIGKYWGEPDAGDAVFDVRVNNLTMPNAPYKQSFLYANGVELDNETTASDPEVAIAANIKKIWAENWVIGGVVVEGLANLPSQLDGNGLIRENNGAGAVLNTIWSEDLSEYE